MAWAPADPGDPGPDAGLRDPGTRAVRQESFDLPKLTVAKSADRDDLPATGQTVTYTVVVTNPGPGDYTAAHPATFSDDLSDVLDDATFGRARRRPRSGTRRSPAPRCRGAASWRPASSATITYTVTYRATGDHVLDNTACVPAAEAQVPAERVRQRLGAGLGRWRTTSRSARPRARRWRSATC